MTLHRYAAKLMCVALFSLLFSFAQSQTADFTFSSPGGALCIPANVQFTQTATGSPVAFLWDFGNGTTSTSANPSVTYTLPGSYVVKLSVVYALTAIDVVKTVVVNPAATVSITPDRSYICKPGLITFSTSGNIGAGSYAWTFGDGTSATSINPVITHNYTATDGNFYVVVNATNQNGCKATNQIQVRVAPPDISASVSATSGCIPALINFNATINVPVGGSVTEYAWNFGDTTNAITAGNSASHVYNNTYTHRPTLTIKTNEGCTNMYDFGPIAFGTPPTNTIAYLKKDTICGSDSLVMVAKAVNANHYTWTFGDGLSDDVTDTIIAHKYASLGSKSISVIPDFNGCVAPAVALTGFITGVIAGYRFANDCSNKQVFTFTDTSLGNVSTTAWNLGDGTTVNNQSNFQHAYLAPGAFTTRLTVHDNVTGCSDTISKIISYSVPRLTSNDTLVCKGNPVSLSVLDNKSSSSAYKWHVAGDVFGPITDPTIRNYATRSHGQFYNFVEIDNGPGYCIDTVYQAKLLRVRGPRVGFTAPDGICVNIALQVTNTTTPFNPEDTLRLTYWNFYNKATLDTIYQPNPFKYTNPGNYGISLYTVDKNGCRDSIGKPLAVYALPFVSVLPAVDTLCLGQSDSLRAFHSDSLRWTPAGQVNCANCDTILVSPTAMTVFTATATNAFGCISTDSALVKVFSPFTTIPSFTDTAICLKDSIRLGALPAGKKALWLPATGLSAATIYNPRASPSQTTLYRIALIDSAGCFSDTAALTIRTISLPTVDAGPSRIYPYYQIFQFEPTYSPNVVAYKWTPGNLLNCADCPKPSGRNETSQTYTVRVTSDSGCIAKDSVRMLVECKYAYLLMPDAFTPDNNGLNDYFYPLTRGISTVTNFIIYNRMGQIVFKKQNFVPNDKQFGWDGRYNGTPLTSGTYIYMLEAICEAGETLTRKGTVMLLK